MEIKKILEELDRITDRKTVKPADGNMIPSRNCIVDIVKTLQAVLFEGYFVSSYSNYRDVLLTKVRNDLAVQIRAAFEFSGVDGVDPEEICDKFFEQLPTVKSYLQKDIIAIYNGDPAAKCYEEVLICYPGFYAISIYRIAHVLYNLNVPLIPRIMTEYAHEKTGIDIHAGATIGEYFFIDHGTGIVIGETTTIGKNVKLYQGVTLGAKSFELDENGNPVKNIKRHPDIGNNVVIYANATILGGNTKIGDNCTIGASVWLTRSVEPGKTVYRNE